MSAKGTNTVTYEVTADGVALVTLDHYPLNTLSNAVSLGLQESGERAAADAAAGKIKAVVLKGAGTRAFCAGADVVDLNKKHDKTPTKPFMECFEDLPVPVVAAIQGFALGGGLELALGCHYRVIAGNGAVGLPEVNIGLLPGGQGTQRLPRLMGAGPALELMLSGAHVPAAKALATNVVDLVVPKGGDLLQTAVAFALDKAKSNPTNAGRNIRDMPPPTGDAAMFKQMRAKMAAKRRGQTAPLSIIACVEAACTSATLKEGARAEYALFSKLIGSKQANALQHVFFSERGAAKVPGLTAKPAPVRKVALIGAGLMAGGIAMCFAEAGVEVTLLDREEKFLDKGMGLIKGNYARSVKRGSKSQAAVDKALAKFKCTTKYEDLADVDLVVEAVFEDMKLKKEIFAKLDAACKPSCILATNTSFLSIDEIGSATKRPEMVIGMHFFSPANVQLLLEVIKSDKTSDQAIATAMALGGRIGKWSVLMGNCDGFVANRMMRTYGVEARALLMEGTCSFTDIDAVPLNKGLLPLGPFMLTDLTGLGIGFEARKRAGLVDTEKILQDWLHAQGRLGINAGAGFYDYSKDRKRTVNPDVLARLEYTRKANGATNPRSIGEQEIFERLFYPIINEGFKILEEGIVVRPSDIDVTIVHGYSWSRPSGGPMHMADNDIGLPNVLDALKGFAAAFPGKAHFKPSQLLVDCVNAKQTLAQYWAKNSAKYLDRASSKL